MISKDLYKKYLNQRGEDCNSESGISLMLSVLVLAAITAIVFSFTTIVLIELRASGDLLRSEPALYATLGVTEEALFQYKRYVNDGPNGTLFDVPACFTPSDVDICFINGVTLQMPPGPNNDTQPLDFDSPTKLQTVFASETLNIPLYVLDPPEQQYVAQYRNITFEAVPSGNTGSLYFKIMAIPRSDDIPPSPVCEGYISENNPPISCSNISQDDFQYELILDNSANPTENFQITIQAESAQVRGELKGLPFVGKKVLRVVADYLGITRNYYVYIPIP